MFYERTHTRDLSKYGGAVHKMPIMGLLFLPVAMSSMGVPGTNGFVNEFLALWGGFQADFAAGAGCPSANFPGPAGNRSAGVTRVTNLQSAGLRCFFSTTRRSLRCFPLRRCCPKTGLDECQIAPSKLVTVSQISGRPISTCERQQVRSECGGTEHEDRQCIRDISTRRLRRRADHGRA
jgi:hypothetical protein